MSTISAPDVPSGLFAVNIDQTQVYLSWTDNSDDESNFEIQRSEVGGSYTTIATVGGNTLEYIDHTVEADKSYIYHIRAVNQTGNSAYSSESYASTYNHPGNALTFDGNDYIEVPDDASLQMPSAFTIEFWMQTTASGNKVIIEKGSANDEYSVQQFSGNAIGMNIGGSTMSTSKNYNDGVWHHVAMVYRSAGDGDIFVDGIRDVNSNDTGTPSYSATPLQIGSRSGSLGFIGTLDEIRIWSEARTVDDIQDRMNERLEGTESNLVAYYTFDQSSGALLPDHSELGSNHGTLMGGQTFDNDAVTSGGIAPSDLQIVQLSGTEVQLSWTGNVIDETAFIIERSAFADFSVLDPLTPFTGVPGLHTFNDNPGTDAQYYYRIQAERAGSFGTAFSNIKFGSTLSPPGHALNFDGIDDFVDLGIDEAIKPIGDFTIELWIKTEATAEMTILSNRQSSAEIEGYAIKTTADGNAEFLLALDDNSTWDVQLLSDAPLNQDQWYHIAVTFTSGSSIMYLNGASQGGPNPSSGSPYYASEKVRIGGDNDGFYFDGEIDELRYWSVVRTPVDIQDNLYNDFPDPTTQPNLEVYYKFDQGLDSNPVKDVNINFTNLPDRSIGNNNGILNNFTLDDNTDDNVSNWIKSGAMNSNTDPVAATDVFARLNDNNEVVLTWTDNAIDDNAYEIVRSSKYDMSSATSLAILPANSTTFTDKTVSATTQYYYRVDAVNQKSAQFSVPEYVYFYENSAGQALNFDGTDDYVLVPSNPSLEMTQYTLELWAKIDVLPITDEGVIFLQKGQLDTNANGYLLGYFNDAGTLKVYLAHADDGPGVNVFTPEYAVVAGEWNHFAGVYNGSTLEVFVNGISLGSTPVTNNPNYLSFEEDLKIGASQSSGGGFGGFMNGELDEVRIWSDPRLEAEIQSNMFNSLNGNETDLVAYYKFDQVNPSDEKLTDRSKNTNDGDWFGLSAGTNNTPNWVASGAMAPDAPTDLYTDGSDGSTVVLHWMDNSAIETSFVIERSTDPDFGSGVLTFEVGANATSFTDNDFETESGYFYRLRAVSPTGESENSNVKWGSITSGVGNALDFDGTNDYVVLDDTPFQFGIGDFTLETWIYFDGNDQIGPIIQKRNNVSPFNQFFLSISNGDAYSPLVGSTLVAGLFPDGRTLTEADDERVVTSLSPLTVGWHHIALVQDYDTQLELFVDGVSQGIDATSHGGKTFDITGADLNLGFNGDVEFFTGRIDEVRIWNDVRSESEIQDHMFGHISDVASESNLLAYYRFDQGVSEGDNTTPAIAFLPDRSINNNDGLLNDGSTDSGTSGFLLSGSTSNWVESGAMAPVAPSNLFAEETGTNEVTLTWTDNSSNEVEFRILRSTDLDVTENVSEFTVGANVSSFIDNTLAANTGYFYTVEALTESLGSGNSNVRFAGNIKTPGNALDFDGIDDYVNLGDPSEVDFGSGNFTIELWFKPNSLTNGARNLVSKNEAGQRQFELQFDRDFNGNVKDISIFYYLADDSFSGLDSDPNAITDTEWHHIAALRNGNNFEIYLDGNLIKSGLVSGSINGPMASTSSDLHIGASSLSTPGSFVDGQIDEVRIWRVARTLTEIQNNMFHTIPETEPNLVSYYRFDQGKDGIVNTGKDFLPDRSVNQNDGTLIGFDFGGSDVNISNWVLSTAMMPEAPFVFNATQVTSNGFVADFTAPSSATDIIIDVDDNSDFSSLLASNISSGTSGSNPINVSLGQGTQYYYRARTDINGVQSENVVSNSFMVQPGNVLDFDGTNDYINLFEDDLFVGDFTVEAWVKINELTDYSPILSKQATTSNSTSEFNLQVQGSINGNISFFMGTGSGIVQVSGNNTDDQDISPNTWTHVAATVEGTSMSLYINGTLSGSAIFSGVRQNSTAPVQIGRYENALEQFWPGQIDEVRIWNFARTESDIQRDLYATIVGNNTGLIAYYQFDETTGLTLPDVSVNNNDGLLTNMTGTEWTVSGALTIPPFTVVNTDDSGPGSLRQAIIDANASGAKETILFDIPGNGPWNIELQSSMPAINNASNLGMVIDGTSQPGWDMDAGLMVTLDGTLAGGFSDGLDIDDPNVEVYGLYITNFGQQGIKSSSGMNNFKIGAPNKGNVISGNGHSGLFIFNTNGGLIQGNRIGTSMDGLSIDGNTEFGMRIASSSQNITIGGNSGAGEGNLISGNAIGGSGYAIQIDGADNIDIYGNLIGVDKNGNNDLGNQRGIIATTGADFINIGGSTTGHQNIVAGSQFIADIYVSGTANDVIVDSNIIGLNSSGNAKIDTDGSSVSGVLYSSSGTGTQILNNVISGMSADGIYLSGTLSSDVKITNNFIGTNSTGTATGTGLANLGNGIRLNASNGLDNSTGRIEITGNVISGNGDGTLDHGISLTNTNTNILIQNNKIGVEVDGVTDFSNSGHGLSFSASTTITEVSGNTIAYNDLDGIFFDNQSAVGANVVIGANSYFCNVNGAINFENTPTVDVPVITSVNDTEIAGTSTAANGSTVEIYQIDPSCADNQGAIYMDFAIVQADGSWAYSSAVDDSQTFVATVTDTNDGISEFSSAFNAPPEVVISTAVLSPVNVSPFEVTLTFSEEVFTIVPDDITVTNGSASNVSTSDNIVFTADITPAGDGEVTVQMLQGIASDLSGNGNVASNLLSVDYDSTLPLIDFVTLVSDNSSITVDFTEGVYANANGTGDLIDSDFNVSITGGVATLSSSSVSHSAGNAQATFTLTYTGTPNGNETISIVPFNGSSIYDQAGNTMEITQTGNTASLHDQLAPTGYSVSINNASVSISNSTLTFEINAGEIGANYAYSISSDADGNTLEVTGSGTISASPEDINGVDVSSLGDGTLTVSAILTDIAGNPGVAASATVEKDLSSPTLTSVSIGLDPSGNPTYALPGDVVDIAFTSNEDITNVIVSLLSGGDPVTNGTPSISGGPQNWNIRYAPDGADTEGLYTFTIDFEDLQGNSGAQVATVTDGTFVIFDQTAPIITSTTISTDNTTLTINFNEDIFSDFDGLTDVALNNFSLTSTGGVATVTASSINIVSGTEVDITLGITGVPDGMEVITIEPNDLIYDGAGNNMSIVSNNTVSLNDEKTPILSGLSIGTITDNYVDIYIEVDETSTLYYVLTQSMDQPTFQQILDGQDEFGSPAISANSYAIVDFTGNTYPISGLDPSTTYYVYWAAEDAAGNRSSIALDNFMTADPPVDLTFTTISVPDIPLGIGSNNNLIYSVSMEVSGGTANSIGITFTPNGTYSESDFTNFHFYQSVGVDDFGSATLLGSTGFSDGNTLPLGDVGLLFEETYTDGTVFWYITADVASGATIGNTFGFNAPTPEENFGLEEPINPMDGGLLASSTFTIADTTPPAGYSVTINNTVVSLAESLLSFDINTGELGADYEYEISSSADGNTLKVTGSGTISNDPQIVNNIDVSTLEDGELLVSVILKDASSNAGFPETGTVIKDVTVPNVLSITPSLIDITDADVGAGTFSIVVVYNESMDIGINTPEITFTPDVSSTLTFSGGVFTSGSFSNDTYTMTYNVSDANVEVGLIDLQVTSGQDVAGNEQAEGNQPDAFNIVTANPEIEITGLGIEVIDGDNTPSNLDDTDFGDLLVSGGSVTKTYTINNSGDGDLILGTDAVSVSGDTDFVVVVQPDQVVLSGESSTFSIEFNAQAEGLRTAEVVISNNDEDENPYNFTIQGNGIVPTITLQQPNGGEQIQQNTELSILFTTENFGGTEVIGLDYSSDNGDNWVEIGSGSISDLNGEFSLFLDSDIYPVGVDNLIRVRNDAQAIEAVSDGTFEILAGDPVVTISTIPSTGTSITVGVSNQIIYQYTYDVAVSDATLTNVDFTLLGNVTAAEFVADGFKIYQSASNDFSTATELGTASYGNVGTGKIGFALNETITSGSTRYFWLTASINADGKNSNFNISDPQIEDFGFEVAIKNLQTTQGATYTIQELTSQQITLTSPVGGEQVVQNADFPISWTTSNFEGNETIVIEYSTDAGSNWIALVSNASSLFNGTYNWFVDEFNFNPGSNYKIRVRTENNTTASESSSSFEVVIPDPTVSIFTLPISGKSLTAGSSGNIISQFRFDVTAASADVAGIVFRFQGNSTASDFETGGFKLYSNSVNNFSTATQVGDGVDFGNNQVVFEFLQNIERDASEFYWLTADISVGAAVSTFNTLLPTKSDFGLGDANQNLFVNAGPSFNIIAAGNPSISINSPEAGSTFEQGDILNIGFSTSDFTGDPTLILEYSANGGSSWTFLASNTLSQFNGSFDWTTSAAQVSGNNYKIRLRTEDSTIIGESTGTFEIISPPKELTLINPTNAGITVFQNSTYTINWSAQNFVGTETLIVEHSSDAGATYSVLSSGSVNMLAGKYNWFVDINEFSQGAANRIRVRTPDGTSSVESASDFTVAAPIPPSLSLQSPNSGTISIEQNSIFAIAWQANNFVGTENIFLEYSNDGGVEWSVIKTGTVAGLNGNFNWFVDHEIYTAGDQYQIRIRTSDNSLISASPTFAITVPEVSTINIESPNGGEIYEQKSTHSISFITTGISRTRSIVIEYSINDGTSWASIASGLVGQYEGNYNWFIDPNKFTIGNSYKIRIRTQDGTIEAVSNAFFSIIEPRPILTLIKPNGNEKINRNTTFSITWNSENFQGSETLIIEYSKDGGLSNDWFFIAQGTASAFAGKYEWFINPATYTVGSQYKVRVRNTSSTALDASDQNFQIVPEVVKSIVVTYPNGGEQIEQNSTQVIKWNTTNFIGSESLVVEYTTSSTWQELASGSANSLNGSFNWFIDDTKFAANTNYQIRVRTLDSSVSDRSNELFAVVEPITQTLTMIAPNGGEQIEQNKTYTIRFSSTGFAGSDVLRLEYSNDGVSWNNISTKTVANFGGIFNWLVDDFIYEARSDYRIRVIDDASGLIISESGVFEISEPQVVSEITVSAPNTNEQLSLNGIYEIKWSIKGITDSETLIVEYSSDGGFSGWDFLTTGTVASLKGQYNWFVDEAIYDLGISNKIRVRTADGAVSDESDDFFEIISPDRIAFNILSPNGGEVLQQNTTVDILFNTLGLEDDETIVLEYSTDGFNWTNLAASTVILFNGKFSWFIDPAVFLPHQRYRIRVRNIDSSALDESDDLFEIIEEIVPELTLTSLTGGEQIEQNSTQAITWDQANFQGSESITIDYSVDGGTNWLNLTTSTVEELNGEYVWFVEAATFAVGVNYKVRVQSNNGVVSSESEQPFEVTAPVSLILSLVSPNGGEQIQQNSQFNIKFNSFGLNADEVIDIEWSTDGTIWNTIASNTVANFNGSFTWLVDDATYSIGSNYLIRVQNVTNTLQDQSDAVFEVIAQKSITVLNPNGGEKLDQNRNFSIAFSTSGLEGDTELVVEYSVNGGLFWNFLTDGTVSSLSGNFAWFVDRTLFKASNTYSIRVRTSDGKVTDVSNGLFSVIAPVATFANQVGSFSFTANWNKYPEATGYLLDVSTSKSFDTFVSGYESLSTTGLSAQVTGLYHDTKYYYRVRANVAPDYTSASSNAITVKLPESAELKADSLLLVNVYNEANGENWTDQDQWLQGKVKDWFGVTFSNGSITALDLSGNNLSGSFPDISSGFKNLGTINISDNQLTSVADLSSLTTSSALTNFDFTLNKLDFAALDAISDIRVNSAYSFNPQGLLLEDSVIIAESTSSVQLNRLIGGTDNQYQWYKDGVEVVGGVDPDLGIVPLTFLIYKVHDGVYHVEVTNPAYDGLTLETKPVHLRVSSLERDSLALLAIYDAMDGANWTGTVIGWRRDNRRVGDWTGVVDAGNRITGLNLPGRGVINELPSDIRDITQIKSVDLSSNAITGLPDMTSLKKIESINVSGNKLEFDDFERNLDHLSKMVIGAQNPFGPAIDPVKAKAGVDYPISVKIGGQHNVYEWERKAHVLYGDPAIFEVQPNEVNPTVVLENLRFDNMGTYRCRITNPKVPGLTLLSNEAQVVGTVDLQGRVYDNNGKEVNEGDIGMMVIRDLNTRYDSLVNAETGLPLFKVGLDGYIIRDVPLGDYIIGVRSDPTKYIQTYYVSEYEWLEADTLSLRDKKGKLNINITNIPVPDPGNFGDGTFSGVFEEDDGLDDGRTLGRRRLKGKGCALKRRRGSGRGDADEIFDLYAYVETNDNGEFVFEELIPGTYRFNIEFPGIPMDENSFTEFVVSGDLREANTFTVLATATPGGVIHVGLNEILSIHKEYFGELNVYPNPATDKLTINYDKLTSSGIYARVVDLFGNVLLDREITNGFDQKTELDISGIRNGLYILNFIDTNDDNLIISTSKFVISR